MGISSLGKRWQPFGTSIFTVMSQAAARNQAVNLAQGFPDFDGPDAIKEAAIDAIRSHKNQYAPSSGLLELRELLSDRELRASGLSYAADSEVTVLSGATEAIFSTILALLEPGDEMIAFAPFYDSYPAAALAAGAIFKCIELQAPDWTFDPEALRAAITPKTKLILINTPHNPTGKVYSLSELKTIARIAEEFDLLVVTDEVYEEIIFDGARHHFFAALPGMRERTVIISSTSKTFSMTGWKVGYTFAPPTLTQAIRGVHQFTVFCSATPLQWGMVAALKLTDDYFVAFRKDYAARRDYLVHMLNDCGFKTRAPQGTYFAVGDYSAHSKKNDTDFAMWLTENVKLAAIPLSPFFIDKKSAAERSTYLRFAFCKSMTTLEQAYERLKTL